MIPLISDLFLASKVLSMVDIRWSVYVVMVLYMSMFCPDFFWPRELR